MGNKITKALQPLFNKITGIACSISFKVCKGFEKIQATKGDQDHIVRFSCFSY